MASLIAVSIERNIGWPRYSGQFPITWMYRRGNALSEHCSFLRFAEQFTGGGSVVSSYELSIGWARWDSRTICRIVPQQYGKVDFEAKLDTSF